MGDHVDLTRIAELQEVMGEDLARIVRSLMESMSIAIDQLEETLAARDLNGATRTAHACRNDALMVGATQLQLALSTLEGQARAGQLDHAVATFQQVRELWVPTRSELARVGDGGPG